MNRKLFKYPRTPHLPWSPGRSSDDVTMRDVGRFVGKEIVITEKMDGENMTLYPDYLHARSVEVSYHPSRDWIKAMHASIAHLIPRGYRICGENLYARHSIAYQNLPSYFFVFSIWNERNECLSWRKTERMCSELGLVTPKVLFYGLWDEALVREITVDEEVSEGFVVRTSGSFFYEDFSTNMAKWVRSSHVTDEKHWSKAQMVLNKLSKQ